jgi:hypothetical protein
MFQFHRPPAALAALLALGALLTSGPGCATVGPASIANGRAAYTDVITRTNDEQLLASLVRMRYAETSTLLMVTAITAQSELSVGSELQAGMGKESSYEGNLVPFSVDGRYSESPTISYEPITGADFLKQLVTPLGLDLYGLLVDAAADTGAMLDLLTSGIAGLDSPVHATSPRAERRARALQLMAALRRAGALSFAYRMDGEHVSGVEIVIGDEHGETSAQAGELLDLLGKPRPAPDAGPVSFTLQANRLAVAPEALHVRTRSTMELLQLAARGVDVPADQLAAGIAPPEVVASAVPFLHVHSSETRPEDPFVAVPYRGNWFWVASDDTSSKRGFVAIQTLLLACLKGQETARPLLSLPIN